MFAFHRLLAAAIVLTSLGLGGRAGAESQPGLYGAWGITNLVTTNSVAAVGAIKQVAAGGFHALALRVDSSVVAWGDNNSNQTNVPPGISNIVGIAAGARHNLVLFGNGTVMSWGLNVSSQTNVPPGLNGIAAIAAGADHSVALRTNGTIVTWGNSPALTSVPASATNVIAIAAGPTVTLALRGDGTVVAWGTSTDSLTNLPPGLTNVTAISVGLNHCLALRSNGTIIAWGNNNSGQTTVPAQLTNAVKISAGWLHNLAQRDDGTLIGWGATSTGQTTIPVGIADVTEFDAGNSWNVFIDVRPRFLTNLPATTVLPLGGTTNLFGSVISGTPQTLQWQFNGTPLPDATNNSYLIENFDHPLAGVYSLVASNAVTSASLATIVRLSNAPTVLINGVLAGGGTVIRTNSATIALLATTNAYPRLYYTLDGTEPDFTSPQYSTPFTTTNSVMLRAAAYNSLVTDKALAAPIAVQVIPTYPLVITAPGGTVGRVPAANLSTNSYLSNTLVTLTATPGPGWQFMNWTGAASGTNPETTVLMSQSNYVNALFGTTLNLNTNYPGFGVVTIEPPLALFPYGSVITLTARPDPGRYFFGWAGLLTNFANPVTLTVTNASGLTALFAALLGDQVSLLVLPVNGGGGIQFNPARNVYTNGETVTLTAWNSSNRVFSLWLGDAGGTNNPLTLTLQGNTLIYAHYDPGVPLSQLPLFTEPPVGRSLSPGDTTTLSALATGLGAISYQWRRNNTLLTGATGNQLTLTNLTTATVGLYDVLASNAFGVVTSPPAPVALFRLELAPSFLGPLPLLIIDCAPDARFLLQHSSDLRSTNWNLLTPLVAPAPRSFYIDVPPTNRAQRFYRLIPQ